MPRAAPKSATAFPASPAISVGSFGTRGIRSLGALASRLLVASADVDHPIPRRGLRVPGLRHSPGPRGPARRPGLWKWPCRPCPRPSPCPCPYLCGPDPSSPPRCSRWTAMTPHGLLSLRERIGHLESSESCHRPELLVGRGSGLVCPPESRPVFTGDFARHGGSMVDCRPVACLVSVTPCRPVCARVALPRATPEVRHAAGIGIFHPP